MSIAGAACTGLLCVVLGLIALREARRADRLRELAGELRERDTRLRAQRAEALTAGEARDAHLARLSHECRTPLTTIMGYASLLEKGSESPEERSRFARAMRLQCDQLLCVLNDFIDYARHQAGRLEVRRAPCSPADLMLAVAESFAPEASMSSTRIETRWQGPTRMQSDPERLRQILINLVSNAVKFAPRGLVEIEGCFDATACVAVFRVRDTGVGISPEGLARLFLPFERVHAGTGAPAGSGLGLAISHRLAELLGGTLTAASTLGKGSEFTLTIPASLAEECPAPARAARRVLVVDDDDAVRRLVHSLANAAGIDAKTVGSATEAIVALAQDGPGFDAALVDIELDGNDGGDAARRLRDSGFSGLLVGMSGHDQQGRGAPFDRWLCKPFRSEDLERVLGSIPRAA